MLMNRLSIILNRFDTDTKLGSCQNYCKLMGSGWLCIGSFVVESEGVFPSFYAHSFV